MKLNVTAFALTTGLVWGLGLLALTWWIIAWDGPSTAPTWIGRLYRGYTLTGVGSVVGAIWGFFDGLIGGAVFAWLYNVLAARLGK